MSTAAALFRRHADNDDPAVMIDDDQWSYRQLVEEASRRAALFGELRDPDRPPHIGVLLDNVPDYLFWIAAAALSGATVVGINSTYRGDPLGQLIRHTDCQLLVTDGALAPLLDGVETGVSPERIVRVDGTEHQARLATLPTTDPGTDVSEDDLLLLIFTSGSTGAPKAVRCTQGRYARTGGHVASVAELGPGDVVYSSLPFFHSSSLFTGWASALTAGVPLAGRRRFSASGTLPDIRRYGATMMSYTGKILNYVLATPEQPDDADNPLRLAIGNEASTRDIRDFARRFGCTVRDSYGSTENIIIVRREASMPDGALGTADAAVKVVDPESGRGATAGRVRRRRPCDQPRRGGGRAGPYRAELRVRGVLPERGGHPGAVPRRLVLVGRPRLPRRRGLALLRGALERVAAGRRRELLGRARRGDHRPPRRRPHGRGVRGARRSGGGPGDGRPRARGPASPSIASSFDAFLHEQPDLGPKWLPSFVRVAAELPKLASMKVDKQRLRREAWRTEPTFWRPGRGEPLRLLDRTDSERLEPLLDR